MNFNWVVWALRLAIIMLGSILGYIMAAGDNSGVITTYFAYCEEAMP